jgi:hypothetical protein
MSLFVSLFMSLSDTDRGLDLEFNCRQEVAQMQMASTCEQGKIVTPSTSTRVNRSFKGATR